MRRAGLVENQADAERFVDYLYTQGIHSRAEEGDDGWTIWVYEEDMVNRAVDELDRFRRSPRDQVYATARQLARHLRDGEIRKHRQSRSTTVDLRTQWQPLSTTRQTLTWLLIGASVAASLLSNFFQPGPVADALWFRSLGAILGGQPWRLITPIFLHLGIVHLLFNMYWLAIFGSQIESRRGPFRLAALVLIAAAVSNLAQYLWNGPGFGGMSGVGYALFGYVWMKSRYDVSSGFVMHPNTAILFIAWFILCMTGWVGPIANAAHGAGLVVGCALGVLSSFRRRLF